MRILNWKDLVLDIGPWNATMYRYVDGIMQTPKFPIMLPRGIREDAYYCDNTHEFFNSWYAFRGDDMYIMKFAEFCRGYTEVKAAKQKMYGLLRTGMAPVDVFTFLSL